MSLTDLLRKIFTPQPTTCEMKYLIVGLGNMGPEYEGTRHNIGFQVADALAQGCNAQWAHCRYGSMAQARAKSAQLLLLKPNTYMNLSGNAVRYWMQQEKIPLERLLVVADDLSLPLGALRMKPGGGAAGHNGLKHIAQMLGTEAYPRLRFGIDDHFARGQQIDYVLGRFSPEEELTIRERVPLFCEAVKAFALSGIHFAMCNYNGK